MKNAKTLTHLLFPLFIGMIIGALILGSSAFLIWGIVLLILDIAVGIFLQHAIDKALYEEMWIRLYIEEKTKQMMDEAEERRQRERDSE